MRRLLIGLMLLLVVVPLVSAQEDTITFPALQNGEIVDASFEDDITTHLYAFNASAGDTVTIIMTQGDNSLDPFLVLFNSDGEVLSADDDSGETSLSASITDVTLDDDGIYFVMATSVLFVDAFEVSTDDTLDYTLTVTGQTTPDNVDDASVVTLDATVLSIGNSIAGESTVDTPLAVFYLEAEDGDSATISLEDAQFFTLLHVFAPTGERLAADASLADIEADEAGVYIIIATEQFFYESMNDDSFFEGGTFTLVIE
ncbi:MAG: PPC domain-containing protein [Chloroflexota bacterium]